MRFGRILIRERPFSRLAPTTSPTIIKTNQQPTTNHNKQQPTKTALRGFAKLPVFSFATSPKPHQVAKVQKPLLLIAEDVDGEVRGRFDHDKKRGDGGFGVLGELHSLKLT